MSVELNAADFVKGFEGFAKNAMWDVDAFRIGHGSDTITLSAKPGDYRKVLKGDITTPEMARIDLARRIKNEFIPRVQSDIGIEAWNKLNEGCKIALIDFAYNYGSISKSAIRDAAKTGDAKKVSAAILSSTKNDNERLLHQGDNKNNPLKIGKAYEAAVKMRKALYNRRIAEAGQCTGTTIDNSNEGSSERSTGGGFSLWGMIVSLLVFGGLFWFFFR